MLLHPNRTWDRHSCCTQSVCSR